jgi:uncharacterized UBP type Zn finger protein
MAENPKPSLGQRLKILFDGGHGKPKTCSHLDQIQEVSPSAQGCEECLKTGDRWVHLRICQICGKVGCCDNSKNKHATRHYHESGHPIIKSFERGENWLYCYPDELMFEL